MNSNDMKVNGLLVVNAAMQEEKALRIEGQTIERNLAAARVREAEEKVRRQSLLSGSRNFALEKALGEANAALAQKEALLKEWMHSNFSFKLLAKKYGGRLGISDEQRQKDFDDCILAITEERPEFAETDLVKKVREEKLHKKL